MSHLFKLVPVGLMLLDEEVLVAGGGGRGASVAGEALVLGPPFVSSCPLDLRPRPLPLVLPLSLDIVHVP